MSEPTLLLLESSGSLCSVALSRGSTVIGELDVAEPNSHSTHMAPLIHELMEQNNLTMNDLDAVVVNGGPGSYTGLRIGASLAKGFCFGLNIPMIAISALRSIAGALKEEHPGYSYYLALIDARRENAYLGLYREGMELVDEEVFVELSEDTASTLPDQLIMGGSGASKANGLMSKDWPIGQIDMKAPHLLPAAIEAWKAGEFVDPMTFEPNYIKSVHITTPKKNRYPFT